MREIKFRYYKQHSETGHIIRLDYTLDEIKMGCMRRWQDNTIRYFDIAQTQYTGLKDKNGVEIYEGDILQGFTEKQSMPGDNILLSEEIEVKCRVKWSKHEAMFYFYCRQLKRPLSIVDEFGDFEVIGNIYENPDLLAK